MGKTDSQGINLTSCGSIYIHASFSSLLSFFLSQTTQCNNRVLTFGSYEVYKKALLNKFPKTKPIFVYALAAIFGDLTGSGILCPSEVIKQQMQAGMYSSTREAFTSIVKSKGLPGLYQGYLGGITRDVPFRVAQLTTYELTKNCYLRIKQYRHDVVMATKNRSGNRKSSPAKGKPINTKQEDVVELSPVETAICGAIAGTFSAAITSPLDRIKTLLMTDSASYGGTVASCAVKIWNEEGVKGFAMGVVPRVTYIAPSVVIFFIAYEQVQQRLKHWQTTTTTTTTTGSR
jgi:solute carrier family 25 (mitochondrial S-adenosylmethionine transporter), member 26